MKKIYIILGVALLAVSFLYLSDSRKSFFPDKIGDMALVRYETDEVAAQQVSNMYGLKEIPLAKAYSAVYRSNNATMRIWVAQAPDHNAANDAFNAMNSMLGGSTGHEGHEYSGDVGQIDSHTGHNSGMMNATRPVKVDNIDLVKPDVYMMIANNAVNYYYLKMDYRMGRVYWIIFDSWNSDYQLSIVKQAVMNIG